MTPIPTRTSPMVAINEKGRRSAYDKLNDKGMRLSNGFQNQRIIKISKPTSDSSKQNSFIIKGKVIKSNQGSKCGNSNNSKHSNVNSMKASKIEKV